MTGDQHNARQANTNKRNAQTWKGLKSENERQRQWEGTQAGMKVKKKKHLSLCGWCVIDAKLHV